MAKKTKKASSAKKGGSGRFLFFAKAALIGVAIFCVVLTLAGALMLNRAPLLSPVGMLQVSDYRLQSQVLQQLMREMWNKDAPEISRFDFTDAEVSSLLRSADRGMELGKMLRLTSPDTPPPRYFQPQYAKGWLQLTYPWQLFPEWFFGGCLNLSGELLCQKADKELRIAVRSAKIGKIPFPSSWAERILASVLKSQLESDGYRRFDFLIKDLYYEPETRKLVVIYRPAALRQQFPF